MRVLLSAYQCAPGAGSVSQIGWEWYSRLARQCSVTLVTHVRNRAALEAAGAPLAGSEVRYIDTEWLARPLWRLARTLFPNSEHSAFLLSSLDFFAYDRAVLRAFAGESRWDIVHAVTPVSPSAFTLLGRLGLPLVRGPLNGGLQTPSRFAALMRADSAWCYRARELARWVRPIVGSAPTPNAVWSANSATDGQLTPEELRNCERMPEIAVDENIYYPAPWPDPPAPSRPLRVFFAGRLIPAKALSLLIDAVARVTPHLAVELTVAGDGPMRAAWERHAVEARVPVRFLGAVPQTTIAEEMRRAHVFCLPSVRESGGAVLLEAMSCGRPCLAVAHGGPAELVDESVGRLVPAGGPEIVTAGLADALLNVASEPDAWRNRGLSGSQRVSARHTWNARVARALDLYSEIAGCRAVALGATA